MEKNLFVWAHRGASALAPENSMAAFKLAEQVCADGIELDRRPRTVNLVRSDPARSRITVARECHRCYTRWKQMQTPCPFPQAG